MFRYYENRVHPIFLKYNIFLLISSGVTPKASARQPVQNQVVVPRLISFLVMAISSDVSSLPHFLQQLPDGESDGCSLLITANQPAFVQFAVMTGNGNDMIISLHSDIFSGKYVFHGKAVSGGIGDSGICKNAGDVSFLFK